jgi:hypothetical protein
VFTLSRTKTEFLWRRVPLCPAAFPKAERAPKRLKYTGGNRGIPREPEEAWRTGASQHHRRSDRGCRRMKLPVVSGSEAVKAFGKLGYEFDGQRGQSYHPPACQSAAPAPLYSKPQRTRQRNASGADRRGWADGRRVRGFCSLRFAVDADARSLLQ